MNAVLDAFTALPPLERRALAVMVALHRAASRSDLSRVLRAVGVRGEDGKPLAIPALLPLLEGWQARGLVAQNDAGGWQVAPSAKHALAAQLAEERVLAEVAHLVRMQEPFDPRFGVQPIPASRELFLALYLPPVRQLDDAARAAIERSEVLVHVAAYGADVPLAVLSRAEPADARAYLELLLPHAVDELLPLGEGVLAHGQTTGSTAVRASAAQYLALSDRHEQALAMVGEARDSPSHAALAFVALTRGELAKARAHAREAVEQTRGKGSAKRVKGLEHPLWPWVTLLLLTDQADPSAAALGVEQLAISTKKERRRHYMLVELLDAIREQLDPVEKKRGYVYHAETYHRWIEPAVTGALLRISEHKSPERYDAERVRWCEIARARGFHWLGRVLAEGGALSLVTREHAWERTLRGLERALHQTANHVADATAEPLSRSERIVWVLEARRGAPVITPRLQTQRGSGYSAGRAINLRRLQEASASDSLLDDADRRVVAQLREYRNQLAPRPELRFHGEAVLALVGHPRVFADVECEQHIVVERAQPSLLVEERAGGGWLLRVEPPECTKLPVVVDRLLDRMRVYVPSAEQRLVLSQLSRDGVELPPEARSQAEQTLGKLASLFPTSSALALEARELVEIEADPRIHVQLERLRTGGMRAAFLMAPLPSALRVTPGEGNAVLLAPRGSETLRCVRDLARERDELASICEALDIDGSLLTLTSLVDCLELLSRLQALGERVVVEWRDGDPLRIVAERDLSALKLAVRGVDGWLRADGELKVDDALTLSFRDLIVRTHERQGRFVVLDEGRYLALSSALQRSIDAAEALARVEDGELKLHPLTFLALPQLEGAALELAPELAERLERMRESTRLVPRVPTTFEAELRPYQVEGFAFLARLAHWEAGACLADDMGLGKTLQTLALLVERAAAGPALVVAPVSVCANWCDEARRFAPTLNVRQFAASDREQTVGDLAPFDLLVCSYGVLQQERERLREVQFQTVVLDEAQAIKNASTQRARAALELRAPLRIALTGTPIENHLGELWSILNFVNPGLLGSERDFEHRFVRPIQRDGDRQRAQLLRRLVSPFVLRRKKNEVLDDLPAKTVITLRIEASPEEQALYEALRREALARIEGSAQPGQARIQLFAELMRMRRAACDPSLVLAEGAPESSKLRALEELVTELGDNGHRALVFSQFVDYLTLVRRRLDALGVRYQYLDGSSTPASRSAAVSAFQRGEGDLFLISLKAGGFGLNLTAADYVIHLDPWWNPAVEDQASDRAHRIGQTRPVTIYRMVMQGSIEEKILALHASKRELADDVLEGESRAPLALEQLLELLAEVHAPSVALASSI